MPGDRPGQGVRASLEGASTAGHPLVKLLRGCPGPVVDATAGLGGDTGVLAELGRSVLAIERSASLMRLLEEAYGRIHSPELRDRIQLVQGDALDVLTRLPAGFKQPAVVLLDPMYPPRRRSSALPPKAMQALRLLHEADAPEPVEQLLAAAFDAGPRRVLLKRPPEAPLETARPPTFSVGSKLVRWDAWELG